MSRSSRRRTQATGQPDLFSVGGDAWLARNWPAYSRSIGGPPASPLVAWAMTFDDLAPDTRLLLATMCRETERGVLQASIATLARATASSEQATRQRIDRLLAAELIVIRLWTTKSRGGRKVPLGYHFRILVDLDQRVPALAAGFTTTRATMRRTTTTGAGCS